MQRQQTTIASDALISVKTLLIICALSIAVAAQTKSATDGSTPLGLQPGSPAGSYALSGFDKRKSIQRQSEFSTVAVRYLWTWRSANAGDVANRR